MNILIIGGTKFIGYFVTRQLVERGHSVFLFNRGNNHTDFPENIIHIKGDRKDLLSFKRKFDSIQADVIVDMIPIGDEDSNNLMKTASGIVGRVVAISSCDVYRAYGRLTGLEPGPPDVTPLTELSPLRDKLFPFRYHAKSNGMKRYEKILVERNVLNHDSIKGTILRLPMVYGPKDYQFRFHQYLQRMDDNRKFIIIDGRTAGWKTTRIYVEDAAHAIVLAIENKNAEGEIFNVAETSIFTEKEFIQRIAHIVGWTGEVIIYPAKSDDEFPQQDLVIDSTKIRNLLKYESLTTEEEAYNRTINWERANRVKEMKLNYNFDDDLFKEYIHSHRN